MELKFLFQQQIYIFLNHKMISFSLVWFIISDFVKIYACHGPINQMWKRSCNNKDAETMVRNSHTEKKFSSIEFGWHRISNLCWNIFGLRYRLFISIQSVLVFLFMELSTINQHTYVLSSTRLKIFACIMNRRKMKYKDASNDMQI